MPRKSKKGGAAQSPEKKDSATKGAEKSDTKKGSGKRGGRRSTRRAITLDDQIRKCGVQIKLYAEQMEGIAQPIVDDILTKRPDIARQSEVEAVRLGVGLYKDLRQAADLKKKQEAGTELSTQETEFCKNADKKAKAMGVTLSQLKDWDDASTDTEEQCLAVWQAAKARDADESVPYQERHTAIEWLHGAQYGWLTQRPEVLDSVEAELRHRIQQYDRSVLEIWGIVHDSDEVADTSDPFLVSAEKWHVHVYLLPPEGAKRVRIKAVLKALGIEFREDKDEWLLKPEAHTIEAIISVQSAALYATHDTEKAISDMKHQYGIDEVLTNLTDEEFKSLRIGEHEVLSGTTRAMQEQAWTTASQHLRELGKQGRPGLAEYIAKLPFNMRSCGAKISTLKSDYAYGIEQYIKENHGEVDRAIIYIDGPGGIGKSYTAMDVLRRLDTVNDTRSITPVSGTGVWDKITTFTNLIIDDMAVKHPLALLDQSAQDLYHRNRDNTTWCGKYCVITSNYDFDTWARAAMEESKDKNVDAHLPSVESRVYVIQAVMCKGHDDSGDYYYTQYIIIKRASRFGDTNSEKARRVNKLFDDFFAELNRQSAEAEQIRYHSTDPAENPWFRISKVTNQPFYKEYREKASQQRYDDSSAKSDVVDFDFETEQEQRIRLILHAVPIGHVGVPRYDVEEQYSKMNATCSPLDAGDGTTYSYFDINEAHELGIRYLCAPKPQSHECHQVEEPTPDPPTQTHISDKYDDRLELPF